MHAEGATKRILVVDDDANIRRFVTESLRLRGFEVNSFEAAEPAIEELARQHYDLALLDILLPGVNGLQLCRKLRQLPNTKDLPVIMMTAFYKQADHIREAREQFGATDYLLKPFPVKTLHEKIDQLIGAPIPPPEAERLSIQGNLSETSLPRILHNLYTLQSTGLLHLEQGKIKKVIYIRNGYPIFVRSNMVREFLGQILIRNGILTEDELNRSLETAREKGQQHGMTLIEMGLISPHQLNEILHQQVIDKLLEAFSWQAGEYRYIQAREFKQGLITIDLSPANLILQGLRKYARREQVEELLAPHLDKYLHPAENPRYRYQEIQLSANDQKVLDLCRGQSTTRQVLDRYQLSRKEVQALLATLLLTGILVGRGEAVEVSSETSCEDSPESRARREAFLKDYAWMMEQDYFTLLGVSENASRDQIRKSYYSLVKQYHPDRFFEQNIFIDLKDKVNRLFQRISDAHETLIDATAKARYVNELKGLVKKDPQKNFENILQAETAFQKGLVLFRVKKFGEALDSFNLALDLAPDEAEYIMYQAWSSYKHDPRDISRRTTAKQRLEGVVIRNPRLSLAHLWLGYIAKDEGNDREARKRFERSIQINPNCTEALRELRLMKMRQEKTEKEKKGLLGKMFNK